MSEKLECWNMRIFTLKISNDLKFSYTLANMAPVGPALTTVSSITSFKPSSDSDESAAEVRYDV